MGDQAVPSHIGVFELKALRISRHKDELSVPLLSDEQAEGKSAPLSCTRMRAVSLVMQTAGTDMSLPEQDPLNQALPSISFPHMFPSHPPTIHHPSKPLSFV